jgi:hypothetical protein
MSRHTIPSFNQRYEIIVGWDWPMETYFAQVRDNEAADDEPPIRVWVGGSFDEVQAPEELREPIAAYGTLTDNVIAILRADRGEALAT